MIRRGTFFFEGIPVSEGIVIGPAYVMDVSFHSTSRYNVGEVEVEHELNRFKEAIQRAKNEILSIKQQVEQKIDKQQAAIFDAHLMMLEDPYIIDRTQKRIRDERRNAESVLWDVTTELGEQMKALGDEYFSERNHDLYDITRRVIKFLTKIDREESSTPHPDGAIVVAESLGPAETAQLSREHILGFCTDEGGHTSHTTIMARALGIPALVGVEKITKFIRNGDMLILDGNEGRLILNPTQAQLTHYQKKADVFYAKRQKLLELSRLPAVTKDDVRIHVLANLEIPEELTSQGLEHVEGIGLFRTEFLYLDREELPKEQDHEEAYRRILDFFGSRPVTMRTIDLGGDKLPSKVRLADEPNPFMGTRAIRLCVEQPEILRTQLRSMMRAASGRDLNIMIPMISGLEEFRFTKQMVAEIHDELLLENILPPNTLHLGAMIEIPSAALQAHQIARESDFFSIGTNDLVQYTLAVDRTNKNLAQLYRQTHPAVLQLIKLTVDAGNEFNIPVSVCGEMAGDLHTAALLLGLGVRFLSMSPHSIGKIKQMICQVRFTELQNMAQDALKCATPDEVDQRISEFFLTHFDPDLMTPKPIIDRSRQIIS
ncbi:MAG: phosphoenolpyruvate--protein phosphotransferase [Candidatus Sumerlaeia bacterium]|nr:phosphoenolpyruvate--protein phosphotransferase [Candidatus Sumerlaeia bacterium]